ncbi:MAG: hypothetical protein HYU66_01135, partial [Armatimonadetes bacterium]|nr:hypothetical protein [Armatimonadota bacterium]
MPRTLDIGPFAYRDDSPDGRTLVFRWEEPRDIHRIVLQFAAAAPAELPTVEYWRSHWPGQRVTLADAGGRAGWKPRDDWFNGEWQTADVRQRSRREGLLSVAFAPLSRLEFPELADYGVAFRQTLKLRVVLPDGSPLPAAVRIHSDTPTELRRYLVEPCSDDPLPAVEAYNGELERVRHDRAGLHLAVRCAVPGPLSYDGTIVTLRGLRPPLPPGVRPPLPPGEGGGEG